MILFRCTARVLKRFALQPREMAFEGTTLLAPWYVNLLNVGRARYVICMSEKTLLPVILPARRAEFPSRFGAYLGPVLLGIGIPAERTAHEIDGVSEYVFGKTASQSLLGSMNDFVHCARRRLGRGLSPLEVSLDLAEMPSGALEFGAPDEATCKLFGTLAPKSRILRQFGLDAGAA